MRLAGVAALAGCWCLVGGTRAHVAAMLRATTRILLRRAWSKDAVPAVLRRPFAQRPEMQQLRVLRAAGRVMLLGKLSVAGMEGMLWLVDGAVDCDAAACGLQVVPGKARGRMWSLRLPRATPPPPADRAGGGPLKRGLDEVCSDVDRRPLSWAALLVGLLDQQGRRPKRDGQVRERLQAFARANQRAMLLDGLSLEAAAAVADGSLGRYCDGLTRATRDGATGGRVLWPTTGLDLALLEAACRAAGETAAGSPPEMAAEAALHNVEGPGSIAAGSGVAAAEADMGNKYDEDKASHDQNRVAEQVTGGLFGDEKGDDEAKTEADIETRIQVRRNVRRAGVGCGSE